MGKTNLKLLTLLILFATLLGACGNPISAGDPTATENEAVEDATAEPTTEPAAEPTADNAQPTEVDEETCKITDESLANLKSLIPYEEFALSHYIIQDSHVMNLWYVDPNINLENVMDTSDATLGQIINDAAGMAFELTFADGCIEEAISYMTITVVDENYLTWYSADIVPNELDQNEPGKTGGLFEASFTMTPPLPEIPAALEGACDFADTKSRLESHYSSERENVAFYYEVRANAVNLWAQWDGSKSVNELTVNFLNIFMEMNCLYPVATNFVFIVADEDNSVEIFGYIPVTETGYLMENIEIIYLTALGETVETEAATHVDIGTELIYNTNPPNSGMHFGQTMSAGFYDNEDEFSMGLEDPEGYILHSAEHGYVTIWYNCNGMDSEECQTLKDNLRLVVEADPTKVIVYPWPEMDEPIVVTSWGQMLRLDTFDADLIAEFISTNRSHPRAPEPNVP